MSLINFQKNKKYFLGVIGTLLLLVLGAVAYVANNKRADLVVKFDETGEILPSPRHWYESDQMQAFKIVDYYAELEKLVKKDDVGGATPQETLDLFVKALKAGDTELASRYFTIRKQKQVAKELTTGKENNNLDFLISYLEKVDKGKKIRDGFYRFTVVEEHKAIMSFDLILNTYTNVWKMERL